MTPDPLSQTKPAPPAQNGVFVWLRRLALGLCAAVVGLFIFDTFAPPVSTLMLARWLVGAKVERVAVPLDAISPWLGEAVIASEDARFCLHSGVDWRALRAATVEAEEGGKARGASTIDMQLVKNLFLFPGRFVIRKALELPLTLALDLIWSKPRILAAYLNVAEWGDGVFGAEAASRLYFHKSASALTAREAALLAAALPNPRKRDPRRPGAAYARLAGRIMARMASGAAPRNCVRR
jgi:monofunctional biosynthetic peptidoglycan transglycosylase